MNSGNKALDIAATKPALTGTGTHDSTNPTDSGGEPPGVNEPGDPPPPTPTPTPPPITGDCNCDELYDDTPDYEVHPTLGWRKVGDPTWTLDKHGTKVEHPLVAVLEDAPVKPGQSVVVHPGNYQNFTIDPLKPCCQPWDPTGVATSEGEPGNPITIQALKDASSPTGYAKVVIGTLNIGAMTLWNGASHFNFIGITFQASGTTTIHVEGRIDSAGVVHPAGNLKFCNSNMLGNWNVYTLDTWASKYGLPTAPPFSDADFNLICDLQTDNGASDPYKDSWGKPLVAGDNGVKWGMLTQKNGPLWWCGGVIGPINQEHAFYLHNPLGNVDILNTYTFATGRTFIQSLSRYYECDPGGDTFDDVCGPNYGYLRVAGNTLVDIGSMADGGSPITIAGGQMGDTIIENNVLKAGYSQILNTKGEGARGRGATAMWDGGQTKPGFGSGLVQSAMYPNWKLFPLTFPDVNLFPSYPYLPQNKWDPYDSNPDYDTATFQGSGLRQNGKLIIRNNIFDFNTDFTSPTYAPWTNTQCGSGKSKQAPDRDIVQIVGFSPVEVYSNWVKSTKTAFSFDYYWDSWGVPTPFGGLIDKMMTYNNTVVQGNSVKCLQQHPGFPGTAKPCPDPTKKGP